MSNLHTDETRCLMRGKFWREISAFGALFTGRDLTWIIHRLNPSKFIEIIGTRQVELRQTECAILHRYGRRQRIPNLTKFHSSNFGIILNRNICRGLTAAASGGEASLELQTRCPINSGIIRKMVIRPNNRFWNFGTRVKLIGLEIGRDGWVEIMRKRAAGSVKCLYTKKGGG